MRKLWRFAMAVLVLSVVGCAAQHEMMATMEVMPEAPMEEMEKSYGLADESVGEHTLASGSVVDVDIPDRMIIRNGYLNLVVKDTLATQTEIGRLMDSVDGYIFSEDSYRYAEGLTQVEMSLRVPADRFNEAMVQLREMATEVTRDSVSSDDVTEEYVDLESRLRALEIKATKLEELMDRAEDTEAVLQVYQELSATQQEIEHVKGRMRYLERSAAQATINVSLTPDELAQPVEIAGWRPQGTFKQAVEALIHTVQFLVEALIWILIYIVPVLLVFGLCLWGMIKLFKLLFRRRKSQGKSGESAEIPPA
ncbi:MAG: DUF4349 domain-containing protein [Chloroflexota bacterium]|nr:DUF4349 domain-containing protein [Chloroflexota bacterium]